MGYANFPLLSMLRAASILICAVLAPLAFGDTVALTGIISVKGGGHTALLYFPEYSYGLRIVEGQERLGIKVLNIDGAKGTVQISREGHEETLHLGCAMPAAATGTSTTSLARNRQGQDLSRVKQLGQEKPVQQAGNRTDMAAGSGTWQPEGSAGGTVTPSGSVGNTAAQPGTANNYDRNASPGETNAREATDVDSYNRRLAEALARAHDSTGANAHTPAATPGRGAPQ